MPILTKEEKAAKLAQLKEEMKAAPSLPAIQAAVSSMSGDVEGMIKNAVSDARGEIDKEISKAVGVAKTEVNSVIDSAVKVAKQDVSKVVESAVSDIKGDMIKMMYTHGNYTLSNATETMTQYADGKFAAFREEFDNKVGSATQEISVYADKQLEAAKKEIDDKIGEESAFLLNYADSIKNGIIKIVPCSVISSFADLEVQLDKGFKLAPGCSAPANGMPLYTDFGQGKTLFAYIDNTVKCSGDYLDQKWSMDTDGHCFGA